MVVCLVHLSCSGGTVLERIKSRGTMVVSHRATAIPFSYLDAQGKPVGYAVDICRKLVEAVRKKLNLKTLPIDFMLVGHPDNISAISEERVDLDCGPTTNNEERRKQVAFTVPHYITGARIMVRRDSVFSELNSFAGHRLVSTKGSTSFKLIDRANRNGLMGITLLEASDRMQAVVMLESGQADGFAMDDVLLYGVIAESKSPEKLKVVGKFLTIEPLAIMLPKTDADFKALVDAEMKRLILGKEIVGIYEHWFMAPIPPNNTSLNLPANYLIKDFWKYPTDVVPF